MAANGTQPMTPVTGTLQIPPGMQLVSAVPTSFSSMGPPTVSWTQAPSVPSPAQAFGMPANFGAMAGPSPAQGFGTPASFGQQGGPSPAQGFNTPATSSSASVYGTPAYTPQQQHHMFREYFLLFSSFLVPFVAVSDSLRFACVLVSFFSLEMLHHMMSMFPSMMGMGSFGVPPQQQAAPLQVATPAVSSGGAPAHFLPPSPAQSLPSPAVSAPSPRVNLHLLSQTAARSDVLPAASSSQLTSTRDSGAIESVSQPVVLPSFSSLTGQVPAPAVDPVPSLGGVDPGSSHPVARDLTVANDDILASVLDRTVGPLNPDGTADSIFGVSPSVAGDHPPLSPAPNGRSPTFPIPSSESGVGTSGVIFTGESISFDLDTIPFFR